MKLTEYSTTGNSAVWKKLHKHHLESKDLIRCSYCRYHHGENRTRKPSKYGDRKRRQRSSDWRSYGKQ
jgi:hypothetical protein